MLVSYIRNENGPFGVVVALSKSQVGVSVCNPIDKFNKKLGLKIAKGRAEKYCQIPKHFPAIGTENEYWAPRVQLVWEAICRMKDRARRYFK